MVCLLADTLLHSDLCATWLARGFEPLAVGRPVGWDLGASYIGPSTPTCRRIARLARVPVVSLKPGGRSRRPLLRQGLGRSTKSRGLQCQLAPQPCRSTEMACNGPQEVLHCMLADFGNSCYNAAWPETLSQRATPSRKQYSLEIPCCDPL